MRELYSVNNICELELLANRRLCHRFREAAVAALSRERWFKVSRHLEVQPPPAPAP